MITMTTDNDCLRGKELPQTKLTEDDVRDIRELMQEAPRTKRGIRREWLRELAEDYCVSVSTIYNIKSGYSWGWLK